MVHYSIVRTQQFTPVGIQQWDKQYLRRDRIVFQILTSLYAALWVSPHHSTTLPVLLCTDYSSWRYRAKQPQKFAKTSTEKYASTIKKIEGSEEHWQQTDLQQTGFHQRHKWTWEKDLCILSLTHALKVIQQHFIVQILKMYVYLNNQHVF